MKHLKFFIFLPASIILLAVSCTSDTTTSTDDSGNWITRASLGGAARSESVSFVIGDVAYVGTGFDGTNRYYDFRAFTPDANNKYGAWSLAPAAGGNNLPPLALARNSAVAFAINGKGYVTTGYNGSTNLKDTWEYNPATSTWAQKADFPEPGNVGSAGGANQTGRYDATAFALTVGGTQKGFVTCGYNGAYTNDMFSFDGTIWKAETSLPGDGRSGAVAFVNNNKAYLITGTNGSKMMNDMWVYDPTGTGTWAQLNRINNYSSESFDDDYTDIVRANAVAVVRNDVNGTPKGYLCAGENGGLVSKTWEYDFVSDRWARKTAFEYSTPTGAVGFTVKGRSFIGLGRSSSTPFSTFYEFDPTVTKIDND